MPLDRVAVGLDLGTSSLKGVAVDASGRVLARASAGYPTARTSPGCAEQDPAAWLAAVGAVVGSLLGTVPAERWAAIGLSAMLPTLVAARRDGTAVGAAITWEDGRAEAQGDRLREAIGGDRLYGLTGQWVDGRYLLPMVRRLRDVGDPRGASPVVAGAKDWLFAQLAGELATDPSTASGFACYDLASGTWDEAIVREALGDGAAPSLPEIRASASQAPLSAAAALQLGLPSGLPVVLGAADSVLAARGLGVTAPGRVAYVAGTSTVILGVADRIVIDPEHRYLVTPLDRPGVYGLEMDLVATGSAVGWLARLLDIAEGDEAQVWGAAADVGPGADGLAFLPYLGPGEQGALWDPELRGVLTGLTLAHGRGHISRALLDGITLESRRCTEVLVAVAGTRGDIVMSGPSVRSPVAVQALADATGRRVRWCVDPDHPASAWGAAALALEAVGLAAPDVPDLAPGITPDAASAGAWAALFERHEAARRAVAPLSRPANAAHPEEHRP
ncbi:MAG: FGGY family carbohydrate kinase [Chloroflexota bacterium]